MGKREYKFLTKLFLISLTVFLLMPPTIHGDGVGYYAYLRSAFFDGDLDFTNEYEHYQLNSTMHMFDLPRTPKGYVVNLWPVGPALLWSPFFFMGHLVALGLSRMGSAVAADGFSLPYVMAISLASCTYAFIGLLLTYRMGRDLFDAGAALTALLIIWFSTSLTAYMYFHPSMAHPVSFFTVALFLFLWWMNRGRRTKAGWLLLGVAGGVMLMAREQNVLFFLVLLTDFHELLKGDGGPKGRLPHLLRLPLVALIFLAGVILSSSPQLLAWKIMFGSWIANPKFMAPELRFIYWTNPKTLQVLFSSKHGLITWTPATALALLGLPFLGRGNRDLSLISLIFGAIFLLQLYLIASWSMWWQGASFSGRMFIECTPIFFLGLAALIHKIKDKVPMKVIAAIGTLSFIWNILLIFQYGTMLPWEDYVPIKRVFINQLTLAPQRLLSTTYETLQIYFGDRASLAMFLVFALAAMICLYTIKFISKDVQAPAKFKGGAR